MKFKKKVIFVILLIVGCLIIHFFSANAESVESNYSLTLYPALATKFREIFGWISFSIGDVLWLIFILFLLKQLFLLLRFLLFKKRRVLSKKSAIQLGYSFLVFTTIFYIFFNVICFHCLIFMINLPV